ncbi:MAG: type II toxin-antitoxin system Phd/YefM family antitoxin [Armatimonadetes bacterium]|nr:type II toxin-antitoxin system Phd/YefM family antitoxin [Armatimonadota bacterium]
MIKAQSIDSLTNFQKNTRQFVDLLEKTKEPLVLTVNGKAKLVVQDAESYQKMLDQIERARLIEAVQEGIRQAEAGQTRPAEDVIRELKAKYGL